VALAVSELIWLALLFAFSLAAVACLVSLRRVGVIKDPDTRTGMYWLLVTSGGWAASHVGYLAVDSVPVATTFHLVGLTFGFATIGPWLLLCSAYTGRRLHRDPRVQRLAVAAFLGVVLLKLTNPIHGLYFSARVVDAPFVYVAIDHGLVHWIVTAVAYVLAGVGYFMLFELFIKTGNRTRSLAALVAVTGLPVLLNLVGSSTALLPNVGYEPLGVAAFAIGILYVFADRFEVVRIASDLAEPAIYLDAEGRIRDVNEPAVALFPALADALDEPLTSVLPGVAARRDTDDPVLEFEDRYYRVTTNSLTLGQNEVGESIVLSDVTEQERTRRELERQNDRLERFASVVSHDLRNPLAAARARLELARDETDSEHVPAAESALDRMETLIEDVLALARQGQSIGRTEAVSLVELVERVGDSVALGEASLDLDGDVRFVADEDRARQLLENLVRNAIDHGGEDVAITIGAREDGDGFYVADDGPGIPADEREDVLQAGYSTAQDGTGFGLAIVSEIADAHGWRLDVGESEAGGARFDVVGVEPVWE
jgi:signal transduction histidine kinase